MTREQAGFDSPVLFLRVRRASCVSNDDDGVDTLATIMQGDASALFRDKAACALAYDQIHLSEAQKVRFYGK